jgi:hypothetical protein
MLIYLVFHALVWGIHGITPRAIAMIATTTIISTWDHVIIDVCR